MPEVNVINDPSHDLENFVIETKWENLPAIVVREVSFQEIV